MNIWQELACLDLVFGLMSIVMIYVSTGPAEWAFRGYFFHALLCIILIIFGIAVFPVLLGEEVTRYVDFRKKQI